MDDPTGIDVSSVTMWKIENLNDENIEMENGQQGLGSDNIENLNEDTEMENEQQEQGMGSDQAPQAFVDDSSLMTAFADEVLCENPVSLGNEMTEFEEFDMSLNQKATGLEMEALDSSCDSEKAELSLSAWMHSSGSDSSVVVVVDQSEAAQVELEYANQGSIDFETDKPNSEENVTPVDEFLPFLDSSFPTPVKLMMSPRTEISGRSPLSPPAALVQAALPTLSTPTRKSSSSKNNPPSAVAQKKTIISDKKENLDNNGWKKIEIKNRRGGGDTTEEEIKNLNNTSLRQLRKMFKVLQIKEKANKNSEDNTNDVKEEVGVGQHF